MIAVIFEFTPEDSRAEDYFALAAAMNPLAETIDGFLGVERFESVMRPGSFLSLSFFRDEAAVAAWRNLPAHRAAQARGRTRIFADYRLRIAEVMRDYGMTERDEAPADSRCAHAASERSNVDLDSSR